MMELLIEPIDVWLFRDGRPFAAGEDHEAMTLFPPTPFTMQGAIRTKVLVDKNVDLARFIGEKQPDPEVGFGDDFGKLKLCGPMIARKMSNGNWERLVPLPLDIVKVNDEFSLLKPEDLPFKTNLPNDIKLLWTRGQRVKEIKGWLPESEWARYLNGEKPNRIIMSDELFIHEPRFGIAIERSKRTTQTQMLYRANFVRLRNDVALWAKIDGVKLEERGFLRFGGEGRGAIYKAINPLPDLANYTPRLEKRFKVVLISPAWFSGGWKPKDGDWSKIFGTPVSLIAAIIPRPQRFGGFDMARGEPKPMRNFVPAGAVYFFEGDGVQLDEDFAFTETPEEVMNENNGENAWARIGFGKVFIGIW